MKVSNLTNQEWQNQIDQYQKITFFHTPTWYEIWSKVNEFNYKAILFEFSNSQSAILPISWLRGRSYFKKFYHSSPIGTYGGLVSLSKLDDKNIESIYKYLLKYKRLTLCSNPLQDYLKNHLKKTDSTYLLTLEEPLDEIITRWSSNHKRCLKKGLQNNLTVRIGKTIDEWRNYYELYQLSQNRWKNPTNNFKFNLFEQFQKIHSKNCRLWLCYKGDTLIAGTICFYQNFHAVYWHGSSDSNFFDLKPNHVIHYEIIKHAKKANFIWYDLNPSGGHESVEKFKKGFGGKQTFFTRLNINQ